MNIKRLTIAIVVAFFFTFITDFVVHALWLDSVYKTAGILRTEPEQVARFPWMVAGHLLLAVTFVVLWARRRSLGGIGAGAGYGFLMGLFAHVGTMFLYVSMPIPGRIAVSWIVAGVLQATVLGMITAAIYRPPPTSRFI
jgi:hypothetical protein